MDENGHEEKKSQAEVWRIRPVRIRRFPAHTLLKPVTIVLPAWSPCNSR